MKKKQMENLSPTTRLTCWFCAGRCVFHFSFSFLYRYKVLVLCMRRGKIGISFMFVFILFNFIFLLLYTKSNALYNCMHDVLFLLWIGIQFFQRTWTYNRQGTKHKDAISTNTHGRRGTFTWVSYLLIRWKFFNNIFSVNFLNQKKEQKTNINGLSPLLDPFHISINKEYSNTNKYWHFSFPVNWWNLYLFVPNEC